MFARAVQLTTPLTSLRRLGLALVLLAPTAPLGVSQSFDPSPYPGDTLGRWGAAVDLDGVDGLDVLVANEGSGSLSRLDNGGDGTFLSSSVLVPGTSANASVAAADLDGDGDQDVVIANHFGGQVVLMTNTSGTLSVMQTLVTGGLPYDVITPDLDGVDGPDIVIVNAQLGLVSVWRNEGGGVFESSFSRADYPAAAGAQALASGDFDGDGLIDVAATDTANDTVLVFPNQGGGVLGSPALHPVGQQPGAIVATDLDGDTRLDLVTANWMSDDVSILIQAGGTFAAATHHSTGTPTKGDLMGSGSLASGDLDCDGDEDLAVANLTEESVTLFFNDGTGGLTALPSFLPTTAPSFVGIADLDDQSGLDLYVTNVGSPGTITVFRNASSACPSDCVPPPPDMIAWWDFLGAGASDLIGDHQGWPIGSGPHHTTDAKVGAAALHFNGSDGFCAIADASSLDIGQGDLSLDAWVRAETSTGLRALVEKVDGQGRGYGLYLFDGNEIAVRLGDGSGSSLWTAEVSLETGTYRHVTVTVDRDHSLGGRFYVDGLLAGVFDPTPRGGDLSNDADLFLGHGTFGGSSFFQGDLDEIELFGRALAHFEVARLAYADEHGKCKPCLGVSPPSQQVAWWPFDEANGPVAHDIAGGNDGAHQGPQPDPAGQVGGAIRFDSSTDKVVVPHHSSLNFGTGDFSWDFWVYRATDTAAGIFDKYSPQQYGYRLFINANGGLTMDLGGGGGCHYALFYHSTGTIPLEKWTHVAVTVDRSSSSGIKFYIDSALAGTHNATLFWGNLDNTLPLWMGELRGNWQLPDPELLLDEVEFHKKVLSPSEIQRIFQTGHQGKCKEVCRVPAEKSIHPWQGAVPVHVAVYNGASSPKTFTVQLAPVPAGAWSGLTVDGPTVFTFPDPQHPQLLTVPAGSSGYATVLVERPLGMTTGDEAGYVASVTDVATGRGSSCVGSLRATDGTFEAGPDFPGSLLAVPSGEERTVSFSLTNHSAPTSEIDFQVVAGPSDGDASDVAVRLEGLPPGRPVGGTLSVAPGQTKAISVEASFAHSDAINLHEVVLLLDVDRDGVLEREVARVGLQAAPPRLWPPADLRAERDGHHVELGWIPQGSYDRVEVRRDGELIAVLPGGQRSFRDSPGFGAFTYEVIGIDDSLDLRSEPSRVRESSQGARKKR